jgi:peptidoglycan/LPS O-acetylase OafA/YrhL
VLLRFLGYSVSAPLALGVVFALLLWPIAPLLAFQAALAVLVGACVINEQHGLAPLLRARPIAYLGSISYGLYLLNSTAIGALRRLFPTHASHAAVVFFSALPLSIALAALSHHFLEARFLRLRTRFQR